MPAEHGRGLHQHERVSPGGPAPTEPHPEEPIDGAKPRAAIATGQHSQLMAEREIFQDEIGARAERGAERRGDREAESNRGRNHFLTPAPSDVALT